MRDYFINLFKYNDWANREVLNVLSKMDDAPQRAIEFMSHIIAAQRIWLGRILKVKGESIPVWKTYTLKECIRHSEESSAEWFQYLDVANDSDFSEIITYKNSKGHAFESNVQDISCHVINHSTHHRAQIVLLIRQQGTAPPPTDYIFYVR